MELLAILLIVLVLLFGEQLLYKKLVLRNVEYRVRFNIAEAFEGDTIEIIEEVENNKWLPVPWLKTELSTSRWLEFTGSSAARASDARFVPSVFALKPYQKCTRTRKAAALKRGSFRLESSSLIGSDLLGLVSVSRSIIIGSEIRILPAPYEVAEGELSAKELTGEIMARRFICDDPFLRAGSREYTGREPMNRISWNASAGQGKLMVYQNDFTTTQRALLIMNLQRPPAGDPRPPVIADTETMIKAAAFILELLAGRGCSADLASNGSGEIFARGGAHQEDYLNLLRRLSALENSCDTDFRSFFEKLDVSGYTDIVIFTPYIDESLLFLAKTEKRRGRQTLFYCCGNVSDEIGVIPMGRLHKYVFTDD